MFEPVRQGRGLRFWTIFGIINLVYFLALIEATSVSTALPTIIDAVHGDDQFVWVGSIYNIASTAFMPMYGGLSQIFGRKPMLLIAMSLFAIGSLVCGVARTMVTMLVGRAIQGTGSAGLYTVAFILLSDIVSLRERGHFNGLLQITWCVAAGIGPLIGGAVSKGGEWRWLFYMNLPVVGIGMALTVLCLHLNTPPSNDTIWQKLGRLDWIGNLIVISATTTVSIALTWSGIVYTWSSAQVLVPLILGLLGLVFFVIYESKFCKTTTPLLPWVVIANRTTLSGYAQVFFSTIPFLGLYFYLPVYFQATMQASPLRSGVLLLPIAMTIAPVAVISSLSVHRFQVYRPQSYVGWIFVLVSLIVLATVYKPSVVIGIQVLAGVGFGIIYAVTYFPVLAPLPTKDAPQAMAFFAFVRQFASIWALTIGGAVLQNASGQSVGIQHGVSADSKAYGTTWAVMAGIAGAGFVASWFMEGWELSSGTEEEWGIKEEKKVDEASVVK